MSSLSGLTPSEARAVLASESRDYLSQPVAITYKGEAYSFVPSASGVSLDIDGTIFRSNEHRPHGINLASFAGLGAAR